MTQQPPDPWGSEHQQHIPRQPRPGHYQQPPPPQQPRRRKSRAPLILGILTAGAIAFAGCIALVIASSPDTTGGGTKIVDQAATGQATPAETTGKPATTAKPKPAEIGPGTYEVGVDIRPGTYVSAGAVDGLCYWARLKDFEGGGDSLIANDASTEGRQRVTIRASDKGFETNGCAPWVRQP